MHTNSRAEKQVARHLTHKFVEHFLPTYRSTASDRTPRSERPLFPGYLFVKIDLPHKLKVIETPGVVSIVGYGMQPVPVADEEIERLRRIIGLCLVKPHPLLVVGQKVRIVRGPLTGCEGILERIKGSFRLVITVATIMRSFCVEVDAKDVEPLLSSSASAS